MVNRILQDVPFQTAVMGPLAYLSEFVSHEQKLFSWLRVHIAEEQSQIGEPLPFVARHFSDKGAFAVDNFIVREGEHEIFREAVEHAESQLVVMEFAVNGIVGEYCSVSCIQPISHLKPKPRPPR